MRISKQNITAIVADDIQESLDLACDLLQEVCPEVTIIKKCTSLGALSDALSHKTPDVVLLDIQFAAESKTAFDLLDSFQSSGERPFKIIIFSGHCEAEYYDMAFQYQAVHFLPKPIDKNRLREAFSRLFDRVEPTDEPEGDEALETLLITTAIATHVVSIEDIVCLQSVNAYTHITLANDQVIKSSRNIGYYGRQLERNREFIRVHSNTILNLKYVQGFSNKTDRDIIMQPPFPSIKASRDGFRKLLRKFNIG